MTNYHIHTKLGFIASTQVYAADCILPNIALIPYQQC